VRIVNMIMSTPPIGSLQVSWNDVGMRNWLIYMRLQRSSPSTTQPTSKLHPDDRERLLALGRDLPRAWYSAGASVETRKKILRLLIEEIVANVADKVELVIHCKVVITHA
jgi:hypothetical protein